MNAVDIYWSSTPVLKRIAWKYHCIKDRLRHQKCRRVYNHLSRDNKSVVDYFQRDPDSLIQRGEL